MSVVLPGDEIDVEEGVGQVILGPGLTRDAGAKIKAIKPGVLRKKLTEGTQSVWVDSHSKRYVAARGN